jgi:BBSome-interacting protein 1
MSQKPAGLREILPKAGLVVSEKGNLTEVLCKPKLMPLKSITLQKLEEMEASGLRRGFFHRRGFCRPVPTPPCAFAGQNRRGQQAAGQPALAPCHCANYSGSSQLQRRRSIGHIDRRAGRHLLGSLGI